MIPATLGGFSADLVLAAVLGGAIGLQRQAAHKPAGFRTHLLVALGSCAFMKISRLAGDTRIAANVITGIGFLGAGAIVRAGTVPRGLTTAASIWAASAIGLALGFGTPLAYALAAVTTLLVFCALAFTDKRLSALLPAREEIDVAVTFDVGTIDFQTVAALFDRDGVRAKPTEYLTIDNAAGSLATWHLVLRAKHHARVLATLAAVAAAPGVRRIETSDSSTPE